MKGERSLEEAIRLKICEEYKNIYQKENFYLCGTCMVNVPVLRYFVNIKHEQECELDLLENAIFGCIEKGISEKEQICYLLGIDEKMFDFSMNCLLNDGYVGEGSMGWKITQKGKMIFEKRSKLVLMQEDEICCFNALTGKWMLEANLQNHQLINLKDRKEPEAEIWLDVIHFAHFEDNVESAKRSLAKWYDSQGKHLTHLDIHPDYTMRYHSYLLLMYKNRKQECRILCVDGCGNSEYKAEPEVGRVIKELYEKKQIMELIHIYEDVKAASLDSLLEHYESQKGENEAVDMLIELLLKRQEKLEKKTQWVSNQEMRQAFLRSLKETERCLYIISPWINEKTVNKDVLDDMEALLQKGAGIHIIYGIETEKQKKGRRDERNAYTEKMANAMKDRFAEYGELFEIRHGSTHEKVLISDKKYCISGSLNFLSYDGGESTNFAKGEFRNEGGFCCYDDEVIQQVIDIHFN